MDLGKYNWFGPKHTYNKLSDLVSLSPEDIVRLDPREVPLFIINTPGEQGKNLNEMQLKALRILLQIKKNEKEIYGKGPTTNLTGRNSAISNFLGDQKQIKGLLDEARGDLVNEHYDAAVQDLQHKDLRNRHAKLNGWDLEPYSEEENKLRRLMNLKNKGGKKRKTYKRKRRVTKKRRPQQLP